MSENIEKFTGKAEVYAAARPGYPQELMDYLCTEVNFSEDSTIADIGSGTGKFTSELLKLGAQVYAVEPNADMRSIAEKDFSHLQNFHSINGTSDFTGLYSDSVDHVTVAQAFHWFDADKFKEECLRILKPNGTVVLLWNMRCESEFNTKCAEIITKYCTEFNGFSSKKRDGIRVACFFDNHYIKKEFFNPAYMNKEKFIARCESASYSIPPTSPNYSEYISELEGLFDQYAVNGIMEIKNKTVAYIGRLK